MTRGWNWWNSVCWQAPSVFRLGLFWIDRTHLAWDKMIKCNQMGVKVGGGGGGGFATLHSLLCHSIALGLSFRFFLAQEKKTVTGSGSYFLKCTGLFFAHRLDFWFISRFPCRKNPDFTYEHMIYDLKGFLIQRTTLWDLGIIKFLLKSQNCSVVQNFIIPGNTFQGINSFYVAKT